MKYLKATLLGSGALASLLLSSVLTSCQDEDFGYTSEEISAAAYDRNFISHFGPISPDQTWDLSKYAVGSNAGQTRASQIGNSDCALDANNGDFFDKKLYIEDEWYYVDESLIKAFNEQLGEGVDNSSKGESFTVPSTGHTFHIIPLFQGVSGLSCDLHMVVQDDKTKTIYDRQIWKKGQNLEKQDMNSFVWNPITNPIDYWGDYGNKTEYHAKYYGSTYGAKATRTKPIRCDIPKGYTISFYLHITKGHLDYGTTSGDEYDWWNLYKDNNTNVSHTDNHEADLSFTGVKQKSTDGKMIALQSSTFTNKVSDATKKKFGDNVMIIGCEDALYGTETAKIYTDNTTFTEYKTGTEYNVRPNNTKTTHVINKWEGDNDMNDLVFMIISDESMPIAPTDIIEKRYLIEDLGSVVDWDFNDIVVDLFQKKEGDHVVEQKAILRHKCGTTPFIINVGDAKNVFGKQTPEIQSQGTVMEEIVDLSTKKINGMWPWNPDQNNITVQVYPKESLNYGAYDNIDTSTDKEMHTNGQEVAQYGTVDFPEKGKVPRIIAVDTDFLWTKESENIKKSMWTFYTITTNSSNAQWGTVSGGGSYREGLSATLKAKASSGYKFIYWSDDHSNTNEVRTVTADRDKTIEAIFASETATDSWTINGSEKTYGPSNNSQEYTDIKSYLSKGYNTINVTASNNDLRFCICKPDGTPILNSDPQSSFVNFDDGRYVLSKDQMTYMQNNPFVIKKIQGEGNITSFNLSKTPEYYTIELALDTKYPDYYGYVTASGKDGEGKGQPFTKACYPAGVEVTLNAVKQEGVFSHWTDENGNVVTSNSIKVSSDTKLTAHFVPAYTLTLRLSERDIEDFNNVQFVILGNSSSEDETLTLTNGIAKKTFTGASSDQTIKVMAKHTTNSNTFDIKYVWTCSAGTTYNGDRNRPDCRKEITVPEAGLVVTVGVTYQVNAYRQLLGMDGSTLSESKDADEGNDVPGYVKIDGNGRQVFLHKGATFNATAIAYPGYRFAYWKGDTNNTNPILRNQTVSKPTFPTAIFEDAFEIEAYIPEQQKEFGSVIITNNSNNEKGNNSLWIPKRGSTSITLTANVNYGYSFVTWGWGTTTSERTLTINPTTDKDGQGNVYQKRTFYPVFAKVVSIPNWGLKNGYAFTRYGTQPNNQFHGNDDDKAALNEILDSNNSTLIFYFDKDLPSNFALKMYQGGTSNELTPTFVKKSKNMAIVDVSNLVQTIKSNGFYITTSGWGQNEDFAITMLSVGYNGQYSNP